MLGYLSADHHYRHYPFRGKLWTSRNMFCAHLPCRPASWFSRTVKYSTLLRITRSLISYFVRLFFRDSRSFTSRKLHICTETSVACILWSGGSVACLVEFGKYLGSTAGVFTRWQFRYLRMLFWKLLICRPIIFKLSFACLLVYLLTNLFVWLFLIPYDINVRIFSTPSRIDTKAFYWFRILVVSQFSLPLSCTWGNRQNISLTVVICQSISGGLFTWPRCFTRPRCFTLIENKLISSDCCTSVTVINGTAID